jgi:hypothetical protein
MTEYLRTETDQDGNAVEYHLYCGPYCWAESLSHTPPVERDGLEEGGAWPCWDSPYDTHCRECGALVTTGTEKEVNA